MQINPLDIRALRDVVLGDGFELLPAETSYRLFRAVPEGLFACRPGLCRDFLIILLELGLGESAAVVLSERPSDAVEWIASVFAQDRAEARRGGEYGW